MSLKQQITTIENEVARIKAIIDGSEVQAKEATVYVIGLVVHHLQEIGVLKAQVFQAYIMKFAGDASDQNDQMGEYARHLASMLDFLDVK